MNCIEFRTCFNLFITIFFCISLIWTNGNKFASETYTYYTRYVLIGLTICFLLFSIFVRFLDRLWSRSTSLFIVLIAADLVCGSFHDVSEMLLRANKKKHTHTRTEDKTHKTYSTDVQLETKWALLPFHYSSVTVYRNKLCTRNHPKKKKRTRNWFLFFRIKCKWIDKCWIRYMTLKERRKLRDRCSDAVGPCVQWFSMSLLLLYFIIAKNDPDKYTLSCHDKEFSPTNKSRKFILWRFQDIFFVLCKQFFILLIKYRIFSSLLILIRVPRISIYSGLWRTAKTSN